MNLVLERNKKNPPGVTIGCLYNNTDLLCFTCEDTDRNLKDEWELATIAAIKIKGQTAIPHGHYEIVMDYSERFKKTMPHLLNVKGFSGIRIHSGNNQFDTAGCILVGDKINEEQSAIIFSRDAFNRIFKLIGETLLNERVYIEICKEK